MFKIISQTQTRGYAKTNGLEKLRVSISHEPQQCTRGNALTINLQLLWGLERNLDKLVSSESKHDLREPIFGLASCVHLLACGCHRSVQKGPPWVEIGPFWWSKIPHLGFSLVV